MHILHIYSFEYDDGFVINDDYTIVGVLGHTEAAAIVATFWDDPELDWKWFQRAYWETDLSSSEYQAVFQATLAQLLHDPAVRERA